MPTNADVMQYRRSEHPRMKPAHSERTNPRMGHTQLDDKLVPSFLDLDIARAIPFWLGGDHSPSLGADVHTSDIKLIYIARPESAWRPATPLEHDDSQFRGVDVVDFKPLAHSYPTTALRTMRMLSRGLHDLDARLAKLPSDEQVEDIVAGLRVDTLRELSAEVMKGSIDYLHDPLAREDFLAMLNSWVATAEETIAADRNFPELSDVVAEFTMGLRGDVKPSSDVVAMAYRITKAATSTESPEVTLDVDGALAFDLRLHSGNRLLAELAPSGWLDGGVYSHDGERVRRVVELQSEEDINAAIFGGSDASP